MRLDFAEPTLDALDAAQGDCLVLAAFADDRPLRGLAGRVDWRLCGRLSRMMQQAFVTGADGEVTLTPMPADRLPFERVLLFGLGRRVEFDGNRFEQACSRIFARAAGIGATDVTMSLPGRVGMQVGLRQAVHGWGKALAQAYDAEALMQVRVLLLEPLEVQRELAEPLREMARRLHEEARLATGQPALEPEPEPEPEAPRDWRTGVRRLVPDPGEAGGYGEI